MAFKFSRQGALAIDDVNLQSKPHWRLAIWCLRLAFGGLAIVVSGLVILIWQSSAGLTVLAIGMVFYLITIAITAVAFIVIFRTLQLPKPTFLDLRWRLILDTFSSKK